jgi:hypothetical protein
MFRIAISCWNGSFPVCSPPILEARVRVLSWELKFRMEMILVKSLRTGSYFILLYRKRGDRCDPGLPGLVLPQPHPRAQWSGVLHLRQEEIRGQEEETAAAVQAGQNSGSGEIFGPLNLILKNINLGRGVGDWGWG